MKLVNLTPHPITLRREDGTDVTIPPSGTVARCQATPGRLVTADGVPVPVAEPTTLGDVENLPEPQDGVVYITSMLVAQKAASMGRTDVLSPGTGPADNPVRDEQGRIVAVTRLVRW